MIYFIRCTTTGLIKVGKTMGKARARLSSLQVGSSTILEIVGALQGTSLDEKLYHSLFRTKHVRGEWFALDEADMARVVVRPHEEVEDLERECIAALSKDVPLLTPWWVALHEQWFAVAKCADELEPRWAKLARKRARIARSVERKRDMLKRVRASADSDGSSQDGPNRTLDR